MPNDVVSTVDRIGPHRRREPTVAIVIRIPETLHTQLHALLVDPRSGRMRYGTYGRTIEQIIAEWVNAQKVHSG